MQCILVKCSSVLFLESSEKLPSFDAWHLNTSVKMMPGKDCISCLVKYSNDPIRQNLRKCDLRVQNRVPSCCHLHNGFSAYPVPSRVENSNFDPAFG